MIVNQENNSTLPNRHPAIFGCLAEYRRKELHGESLVRALSFGCSSGEEGVALSQAIPSAQIYGCDIHALSLKKAARLCGDDVRIFESTEENVLLYGPFHIICGMNVLCRHPTGKSKFSDLYPFAVFENTIETLDRALLPGGVIALYNTQYPAEACEVMRRYEPIDFPILKNNGWLDKYSADGVRRLSSGKLYYRESWLPHSDWIKSAGNLPIAHSDPAALPVQFDGCRLEPGIDTSTVFWKKLRGKD